MCNQKKAEKSHGEKLKETSSVERTLKDADDTVSERKLLKVTPELYRKCKYHTTMTIGGIYTTCYYIVYTRQRQGCPPGTCDKYEKGIPKPVRFNSDIREDVNEKDRL